MGRETTATDESPPRRRVPGRRQRSAASSIDRGEQDEARCRRGRQSLRAWVDALRQQVLARGRGRRSNSSKASIASRIAEIDELLTAQVNEILHAEPFQRLEASWRGLHYLVSNCETSSMLKIRVLNASKEDLRRDLESAVEFDMSVLFHRVYEEEYGMLGGEPFAALIGDYEFSNHPEDIALLDRFAQRRRRGARAAASAAPAPSCSAGTSFDELVIAARSEQDLLRRGVRQVEGVPRVGGFPLRRPDVAAHPAARAVQSGDGTGRDVLLPRGGERPRRSRYLWGNAAYAFGVCLARAFARYSWCAMIRGVEGGGLVDTLPSVSFDTGEGRAGAQGADRGVGLRPCARRSWPISA